MIWPNLGLGLQRLAHDGHVLGALFGQSGVRGYEKLVS